MTTPREAAWQDFVDWCGGRGLSAMPANPWTVAAYIRWLERSTSPTAIHRILRAIAHEHREKSRKRPERHPTVTRTLRDVEARAKERRRRRAAGPDLFPEDELAPAAAKATKTAGKKVAGKRAAKKAAGKDAATKTATKKTAKKASKKAATGKTARPMRQTPPLVRKRKIGS